MFLLFRKRKQRRLNKVLRQIDNDLIIYSNKEIYNRNFMASIKAELALLKLEKRKDTRRKELIKAIETLESEKRDLVLNISRLKGHKETLNAMGIKARTKIILSYSEQVLVIRNATQETVGRMDNIYRIIIGGR